jgi:predicted dehydrogenase
MECVAAGIPMLVEKPLAADVASAERLVEAAEAAQVPILVGHHRRHNSLIRKAKEAIDSGSLGTVLAVQGTCWLHKPDDYFDVAWRREPGAGPVFINLIHDIDSLRHLCGEVASVQAIESSMARGHPVEDTAAILLRFRSGAIGTISVSDAIASPWSWELTAGENPAYPQAGEACYLIGGTHGSLSLPGLDHWSYAGERSWWEPLSHTRLAHEDGDGDGDGDGDPLVLQLQHFCDVVQGRAEPLVSARDGLETLRVVEAVKESARSGRAVELVGPQLG